MSNEMPHHDMPPDENALIKASLESQLHRNDIAIENNIAQLVFDIEHTKNSISFLDTYINTLKNHIHKNLEQIDILMKYRALVTEHLMLQQVYYKKIVVGQEELSNEEEETLSAVITEEVPEDDIKKIEVISHSLKNENDETFIRMLKRRQDEISNEMSVIETEMEEKFPEDTKKITTEFKKTRNSNN